jgi:hypothetical protein
MPRVPSRYRTRWVYAGTATILGVLFAALFFIAMNRPINFERDVIFLLKTSLFGLCALPASFIAWPRHSPRGGGRMVVAGLLTVFMSFVFLGVVFGVIDLLAGRGGWESFVRLNVLLVVVLGSIVTLGIPYMIGAFVSVMFSDRD